MKQTSHPFSTDHFLHGGDYNPDQWLDRPDILEKDLEYFEKAGINCVSLGIFSWAMLEPEEGHYQFDWMKEIIDRLYSHGISMKTADAPSLASVTITVIPLLLIARKFTRSTGSWQKPSLIIPA